MGAKEVGFTLLSMNLSIVAVFVSILFMGGIVERLFREFSITLVSAILISLVVSLTLTPMLCARWLVARSAARPGRLQAISDGAFAWLRRGYGRSLGWALDHAPIVLMILIGVAAFTVHLYTSAPKSFLPQQDTGQLGGFIRGDDGMSFQIMQPKIEAFRQAAAAASTTPRSSCGSGRSRSARCRASSSPSASGARCPRCRAPGCGSTSIRTSASAAGSAAGRTSTRCVRTTWPTCACGPSACAMP
jgi:multidrug efflux pump subunit AcrB